MNDDEHILCIDNLHKSFGGTEVLRDISLDVTKGSATVLIGRSGSGKSTLLRCINGLTNIDDGTLIVAGHHVHNIHSEHEYIQLRRDVSMVFQQYNLFPHMKVLDNITLAPVTGLGKDKTEARDRAISLLEQVGMAAYINEYPGNLSGGQQQRVAIVRALAVEPKVMLFDEVTAALDPESVKGVLHLIENLVADGMTSIIVTHEMGFARTISNNVVFTDGGTIIEHGKPEQVFDNPHSERTKAFLSEIL